MSKKSQQKIPVLNSEAGHLGKRLSMLRKEKGYTQAQLAEKMGIVRALISDYECDRLRPHYEIIIRFAEVLEITTDELLGVRKAGNTGSSSPSLKILRRMKKIEELPSFEQKVLLKTIDLFLKGADST